MEREDSEKRLQEILPDIAEALGWQVVPNQHGHYGELKGPLKGARLGFFVGYPHGNKGKAEITGRFPKDYSLPYGESHPSITVTLSRPAEQIAKDIERKIFPTYETMLDAANARTSERESYESRARALADRIADITGGQVEDSRSGSGRFAVNLNRSAKFSGELGDVKVSDERVTFERFDMTPDEAEAVLRLLIKMRQ